MRKRKILNILDTLLIAKYSIMLQQQWQHPTATPHLPQHPHFITLVLLLSSQRFPSHHFTLFTYDVRQISCASSNTYAQKN